VSFRRRLTLACAAAVALAVVAAAALTYVLVRDQLRGQIDSSLRQATQMAEAMPAAPGDRLMQDRVRRSAVPATSALEGPVAFVQLISPGGRVATPFGEQPATLVPATALQEVADGERGAFFSDVDRAGGEVRVLTTKLPTGAVMQVARPIGEVNSTLATLRFGLGVIVLLGVAAALALARLATRAAVKPVADLTDAAEHVARTRDLTKRIEREGDDELSRLAGAFNTMLEALDDSQRAQRRLVADASHELRTPLTSLRTNLEVLARGGLAPADHERLRMDLIAQLEELTLLVSDLVDLAREEEPPAELEPLALDELVASAVERARRHAPGVAFATDLEPTLVEGVRGRLDRAVANLLDNAARHGDGRVEVTLRDAVLRVRDHGPGIAAEDLPFVFDRFYRSTAARGRPGSGLGLAIVRQAAEAHGGAVRAGTAPGGGAELTLALPRSATS
jgi:two-component system, OmpR family, sensor histidine kinase MprB